jgi:hypothetical protein
MSRPRPRTNSFIWEAFDCDLWCGALQARFCVADRDSLRSALGKVADNDPELDDYYYVGKKQLAAIRRRFGAVLEDDYLESGDFFIRLFRQRWLSEAPYLIHTGYELPLLLDGRKKLARMYHPYPPSKFDGEDRFDHWVKRGLLHREEVLERFDSSLRKRGVRKWLGQRTVYYTPKGEEWRIPASKLIWETSAKSGGWNEHFERLEGMLYGYEDWQNDWWIRVGLQRGRFGGAQFCCRVTAGGLAWIEAAGFRALPPIDLPTLAVRSYHPEAEADLLAFMLEDPESAALVRFNLFGRDIANLKDIRDRRGWYLSVDRIPELNRCLRYSLVVVARRDST